MSESGTSNHFGLIRRKGVYPYDYMDSFDRLEETELPSQGAFFSKLSGSPCSDSEYTHATRVWDAFECKTIGDYHDIYLQLDVLLLADFFEKFRRTCLEFYSLDPLHYYTTPGLAWDATLRISRVDLQPDKDMYQFVENIICGGISMISTRHAQANNPSFSATYDASLPRQDLIYLDANILYGYFLRGSQRQISTLRTIKFCNHICMLYLIKLNITSVEYLMSDKIKSNKITDIVQIHACEKRHFRNGYTFPPGRWYLNIWHLKKRGK